MTNRKIALSHGVIFTGNKILNNHVLLMNGSKIESIVEQGDIPLDYTVVDVHGANICPGLIDLQIYGTGNHLFSAELSTDSLQQIETDLLLQGCTSFYLTLATNSLDIFKQAISVFRSADSQVALGLHLEGPFLNSSKRGAHPEDLIIKATLPILEDLFQNDQGAIKMMTVAPECLDDACLAYLKRQGVLLSAGHSAATFDQSWQAFEKGIPTVTHLWNAMSALHHRNVGLPGASFSHPTVCASIIVDGIHVDYQAVKLSKALLKERLFLITDAVASCDKGIYTHILNADHYILPDGTLSGSALSMLQAIKNCVAHVQIPLDEAIRMATLYPANLIGRTDLGRFEAGAFANVLVFDANFKVQQVYFKGNLIK